MKYSGLVAGALLVGAYASIEVEDIKQVPQKAGNRARGMPGQNVKVEDYYLNKNKPAKKEKVVHEDFVPYPTPEEFKSAALFEQFSDKEANIFKKWKVSSALKKGTDNEERDKFSYVGKWAIEEPTVIPGFKGDRGLVLKTPAAHHAISTVFKDPLVNLGKTLVAQYEVKTQKGLNCGGAYIKLLSDGTHLDETEFSDETPYQIMFGPDKCGSTDKVHLIIKRKNTETGEYDEHHLVRPPRTRNGLLSTLYTLILNPDQTFEIRINGATERLGSLLDEAEFQPPFAPPREIDDASDMKPSDWVDDEYIPDPEQATKPEDWDEDAPASILDEEDEMPEDWRTDLVPLVDDPEATKPSDWDDEEDGEFIPVQILNPECEGISGCGEWKPRRIPNPDYKGKWEQPKILNPDYKGPWLPRKVPNPDFNEDLRVSDLEPIGGVGLEIWTMQEDILFDNFYVGHSLEDAETLGNATWGPKFYVEMQEEQQQAPESKKVKKRASEWDDFKADPVQFARIRYNIFATLFAMDKLDAVKKMPVVAGVLALLFVLASSALFGLFNVILLQATGKPKEKEDKEDKKDKEDKADKKDKEDKADKKDKKEDKADKADKEITVDEAKKQARELLKSTSADLKKSDAKRR